MKPENVVAKFNSIKRLTATPKNVSTSLPNIVGQVLDGASDVLRGTALPLEISQLLNEQFRMQMIMLQTSIISNVSKTKHEAAMTPVRNIRAG